ncbi:hypothetical protein F7725_008432 [Dissostichus mawsoni]|uniref:Ig-like domain-containing protein n=1 Tax=Dissostichus mawsoni TaxID=36200 RepID=A0A7J5Y949_DISMA|nr:hypothetical protein F7725_008432 [Dissostichus mawsoni]
MSLSFSFGIRHFVLFPLDYFCLLLALWGSLTLACLLTGYSPQGAAVSWEVDGTEVTEGVLSSSEEEKSGRYSSSSSLSLSQERWMSGELYSCKVLHHGHGQTQSLHRSQCGG